MGACPFLLGPNPETLSASASTPIGLLKFSTRSSWSFAGYDEKNFKSQYGEVWRFCYGANEPKASTSFLSPRRHDSIVEFLFDDSRTTAATPTIVHLNQMLHTSFARVSPGSSFPPSRAASNSPAGKAASQPLGGAGTSVPPSWLKM